MVKQRKTNPPSSPITNEMRPKKRSRKDKLNISSSNNDDPPLVLAKPKWNWLFLENNGFANKRRIRVYRGLESSPPPALALAPAPAPAPVPMIRSQEQSEGDHIELVCPNNEDKKKTSTKKKKEVKYRSKEMASTPGSRVSKARGGSKEQVSSSVTKRSSRRGIKSQEQSKSDHIVLACANNNEKKMTSSTKKKKEVKYKPKVMANTPGSPVSNFCGGGGSKQVSLRVKKPSCKRALDFSLGYIEEKTMKIYTKSGFTFTRKVNMYHYKQEIDRLKILECNAKEEEEWWKNEHELFRQRALSFISSLRPVQGNRSFMGWKGSVVDSVVGVFLTQNAADNLSSSAFMSLASKYPKQTVIGDLKNENRTDHALDWNAVRCAQLQEISDAIQDRGMSYKLAERILNFLNCIHDNKSGLIDIEWLRKTEPAKATEYLMEVYGLGLKSTECVRLLTLRQQAFPVDRHVSRIVVRLGWVPIEKLPDGFLIHQLEEYPVIERVQEYLSHRLSTLDVETLHELHYQMITFGKVFCTKKKPNCSSCPLKQDCKHFASKFGSNSCLQPGPGENTLVPVTPGGTVGVTAPVFPSPECSSRLEVEEDIEDMCLDPKVPPESERGELLANAWNYMSEKNIPLDRNAVSQALITVSAEEASPPISTLRFAKRLRTEHEVYELPDFHPLVQALEKRDRDDGHPYLLAIWPLGETLNPLVTEKEECRSLISSDSPEEEEEMVFGTFLVPCRTATRGSFPLDGTFFQINEVFADDESSRNPLVLPRKSLIGLNTKALFCGTSITSIFKGMSRQKIQDCFWKGYVCIRGFCMKTRAPRPLHQQFHPTLSKVVKINGAGKSPRRRNKDDENNKSN